MLKTPLVSVWIITYNHENYIRQCLESVLAQQTNFCYEVIIGEDCSTDNTKQIIEEFASRYPEIIKPVYHNKNVGAIRNAYEFCYPLLNGEYVACLEGDDFWTDPLKLQKQVDFLVDNEDFVLSFHNVEIINEEGNLVEEDRLPIKNRKDYDRNELLLGHYLPTPTMMFRKIGLTVYQKAFRQTINGDSFLQAILTQRGKTKFLEDIKPAYIRIHSGGIWSSKSYLEKWCWSLKTAIIIYKSLNKDLKRFMFNRVCNSFEMAAWDANYYKSKKYWLKYNFKFVSFLLMANEYGKAFLILRRITKKAIV